MAFTVDRLDHVELFVPDRQQAAAWYRDIFGLQIVPGREHWAADPHGPLMISSDGGHTKLALFQGEPQGARDTAGFHLVAFSVSAKHFNDFLNRLPQLQLTDRQGQSVTAANVKDHQGAYSIYFTDPYGHNLELTTYDYAETGELLNGRQGV
jgi:catechol 2,3-dioxygenase-like lactoylglutathione lyase family enzyme